MKPSIAVSIRESLNMSQADMARLFQKSYQWVSRVEHGTIEMPQEYRKVLQDLCVMRLKWIKKRVEIIPRSQFKGSQREWHAYISAAQFVLTLHIAANLRQGFNPTFSNLNQPEGGEYDNEEV